MVQQKVNSYYLLYKVLRVTKLETSGLVAFNFNRLKKFVNK